MKFSSRRRWTKSEKWLLGAPVLVGVFAVLMNFGPELVRRKMGLPRELKTETGNQLRSIALSADGRFLAASGEALSGLKLTKTSGTIYLWDARTLSPLPSIVTRPAMKAKQLFDFISEALAFSPDGQTLGVQRHGLDYSLYDVATRRLLWRNHSAQFAQFSPDGQRISLGGGGDVQVLRASDGKKIIGWDNAPTGVDFDPLAWSPDGKTLACVGPRVQIKRPVNPEGGNFVELRRVADGKVLRVFRAERTVSIHFSPDGQTIAAVGLVALATMENSLDSAAVRLFDVATGRQKWEWNGRQKAKDSGNYSDAFVCDAVFSPDGKILALMRNNSKDVLLLDAKTGQEIQRLRFRGETINLLVPSALAFSPDGTRLFARGKDAVLVWDLN